jgi:hypothetical protein
MVPGAFANATEMATTDSSSQTPIPSAAALNKSKAVSQCS